MQFFTTIRKVVLSEFSIREEKASAQGRVVSLPFNQANGLTLMLKQFA
jgi:hypothetical protein